MRPHIGRIVTLWRTGLRLLCGRARYSPCSSKQRAHAVRLRAARSMQSNSIQSRTAARTVLVMQSRTALWCPHGPCGSVSARAMIVQAAPRADRAGCAVRASLSATRGDLSAAPPAAPGAIAPVQARRDHHRCCCGACSGWPLWLRRDRHRPGCRRRRARSARPCQQRNLFQPLSGTAVQPSCAPGAISAARCSAGRAARPARSETYGEAFVPAAVTGPAVRVGTPGAGAEGSGRTSRHPIHKSH